MIRSYNAFVKYILRKDLTELLTLRHRDADDRRLCIKCRFAALISETTRPLLSVRETLFSVNCAPLSSRLLRNSVTLCAILASAINLVR